MHNRPLGKTGLSVSEIGYGAWGIGGSGWIGAQEDESVRALHRAIELGDDYQPDNALDLVRTVTGAGGLYYYWAAVPWTLRWGAVEKFRIYEVRPARSSDLDGLATEGKRRSMD